MTTNSLIHLSDLHIGRGKKENYRANKIFTEIAGSYPGDTVLITGDLTNSATKNQFKLMRELLDRLALTNPILVVPGNHDYAWKGVIFRRGSGQVWAEHLGYPLGWEKPPTRWMGLLNEPEGVEGLGVWKDGPVVYFGVDSGDPTDKELTARGLISPKLAKTLATSLKKYQGKTRVVLVHHHPFMRGATMKMKGAKLFLNSLRNNCELLLFGHKHKYGLWWKNDTILLTIASHKNTNVFSGDCMAITVIEIQNAGEPNVTFSHRLNMIA